MKGLPPAKTACPVKNPAVLPNVTLCCTAQRPPAASCERKGGGLKAVGSVFYSSQLFIWANSCQEKNVKV